MSLNGKAEKDFIEWSKNKGLISWKPKQYSLDIAQSMFYVINVLFFESVGIIITISFDPVKKKYSFIIINYNKKGTHRDYNVEYNGQCTKTYYSERSEARIEAIKKANEIHNDTK